MKKKYQKPTTSLILVRTEQMISASIIDNGNGTMSVDLDYSDETEEISGNLSRQFPWMTW